MKYPQLVSWLLYKKKDNFTYLVKDCMTGKIHSFTTEEVRFFRCLDGKTDPYSIDSSWSGYEVRRLLFYLRNNDLVRIGRISKSFLSLHISLFKIKFNMTGRIIAFFLNGLLSIMFLPVLIIGLHYYFNNLNYIDTSILSLGAGTLMGVAIGLILHETAHALAGAGYGAHVFECGLIIGLSTGAYVMFDYKNVKQRMRRVQIIAAGIEMNLLLAGIGFISAGSFQSSSNFFFGFAVCNFSLGIINLLFIHGLDGCSIMEELLGTKSLVLTVCNCFFDKKTRKRLISQGVKGYVKVFSCFVGGLSQIAYPLLLIVNVLGVLLWIF